MKIELCEDNSFLNDGTPTLVVLVITLNDGKNVRIPYQADKTIQELYVDANKMIEKMGVHTNINQIETFVNQSIPKTGSELLGKKDENSANEIQREDIVKCVKKHPREAGADDDLEVGNEYRVIFVKKKRDQVLYYDVLDDKAENRYRINVLPDEIELVRKRKPKTNPVKKNYKQEIISCDCGEQNALDLIGDRYEGTCEKCGCHLVKERSVAKPVA